MSTTGESTAAGSGGQGQSYLPWHLIPVFKPGTTDLTEYSRKIEFLAQIWPQEHLPALAPRAALLCEGSAFQKVIRLDASKLKTSDLTGVKLLVKTLGGVWGKTTLENKYEYFERIIYGTSQKNDETNESYLARHEVLFEDVINQGATIADMRAYILLRNSALGAEDKKKVIVESGGTLQYDKVVSAIRMLGSKFFQDVQGSKNTGRSKTYEVKFQEVDEEVFASEEIYPDGWDGADGMENTVDILLSEGDEDQRFLELSTKRPRQRQVKTEGKRTSSFSPPHSRVVMSTMRAAGTLESRMPPSGQAIRRSSIRLQSTNGQHPDPRE